MIIAWIISLIAIITTVVSQLEHSTALQMRLLAIEKDAHAAFVAAEKNLHQCEAQLSNATPRTALNTYDASTTCEVSVIDTNARGELIRITAVGSAVPQKPIQPNLRPIPQTQLESVLYRDKRDQSIKRLSWRAVRSVAQPLARKAH
jgi:Tfp pilus assembly protein PilX